ncbi:unnamed protein product [Protopolystoma xenopodis]|uniref:Uncharacterized protein n=1 Tax=Protopolystoma xenopodis TaxID=117903 RepID=A0A3S5AYK5_9PLAT|nr:unnamed protein product [Protopolystoma xenopodis]
METKSAESPETLFDFKRRLALCQKGQKRTKTPSFSKSQANAERTTRNPSGIVLGPQKRTWNTGCHVTQTPKSALPRTGVLGAESSAIPSNSSLNSNSHSQPSATQGHALSNGRNGSSKFADYRPLERPFARNSCGESRKEFRNSNETKSGHAPLSLTNNTASISRPRDRLRNPEGSSFFSRSYGNPKEPSSNRNPSKHYGGLHSHRHNSSIEDEPEWFSEGPSNINETIELVGMNEDDIDLKMDRLNRRNPLESFDLSVKEVDSRTVESRKPEGSDQKAVSFENDSCSSANGVTSAIIADDPAIFSASSQNQNTEMNLTSINDLSALLSLPIPTSPEETEFDPGSMLMNGAGDSSRKTVSSSGGSRLRHLFSNITCEEPSDSSTHAHQNHVDSHERKSGDVYSLISRGISTPISSSDIGDSNVGNCLSSKPPTHYPAVALEQKLRSLLLGRGPTPSSSVDKLICSPSKVDTRSSRVLTVEELEADLGTCNNPTDMPCSPHLLSSDSFQPCSTLDRSGPILAHPTVDSFLNPSFRIHPASAGPGSALSTGIGTSSQFPIRSSNASAILRHPVGLPPGLQSLLKQAHSSMTGPAACPGAQTHLTNQLLADVAVVANTQKPIGPSTSSSQQQAAATVLRINSQLQQSLNMMMMLRGPMSGITQASVSNIYYNYLTMRLSLIQFHYSICDSINTFNAISF